MTFAANFKCPRCQVLSANSASVHDGCSDCRAEGYFVNPVCDYVIPSREALDALGSTRGRSMWEFSSLLPVDSADAVDLGEGWTPLIAAPRLGASVNIPNLYLKNETTNPTWSHKDRLCALATAAAKRLGARATTAASTGNHGASVAAYAARASLASVIFTLTTAPPAMRTLIQSYGATVIASRDIQIRNEMMRGAMDRYGLYPISNASFPAVGSNPFGIEGYKTIAYEIWLQLESKAPDWVIVPTAYGDCLAGINRGFHDLRELGLIAEVPRLAVAEIFGAVSSGLEAAKRGSRARRVEATATAAFSIASSYATDQTIRALLASDGLAQTVSEPSLSASQKLIGKSEGLFVEQSSASALSAAAELVQRGKITTKDVVVLLLTSSGLKDPENANKHQLQASTAESHADTDAALKELVPSFSAHR